ncbi:hypothetical protein BpHYR1_040159 [Brachionus plicatilis]|uniref:Uncharacterized protein n=1 Tax=Brachionus plicatilis TaxID=10195 RepID=A0A3M7SJI0_BRAPC|nr:hypothetical protein BpHYR1_040159 [Brachionus plicatilis]
MFSEEVDDLANENYIRFSSASNKYLRKIETGLKILESSRLIAKNCLHVFDKSSCAKMAFGRFLHDTLFDFYLTFYEYVSFVCNALTNQY